MPDLSGLSPLDIAIIAVWAMGLLPILMTRSARLIFLWIFVMPIVAYVLAALLVGAGVIAPVWFGSS